MIKVPAPLLLVFLTASTAAAASLRSRGLSECATTAVCSLVNLDTEAAIELDAGDTISFDALVSESGFSIGCSIDEGVVENVKFLLDGEKFTDQYYSPETYNDPTEQTFWMDGDNRGTRVNGVHPFKECGEKKVDIIFTTWDGGDADPCFDLSFTLESTECNDEDTPTEEEETDVATKEEESTEEETEVETEVETDEEEESTVDSEDVDSDENVCATTAVCSLMNLDTEEKIELGSKTIKFDPFESESGFSIGCSIDEGVVENVKFLLDGEKFTDQYYSPETYNDPTEQTYWMDGDNRGTRVNGVHPFKECGEKKVDIIFTTWDGGDDEPCFDLSFTLEPTECNDSSDVADTTPPKPAACNLWVDETLFWGYNAQIALGTSVQVKVESGDTYSYPTGPTGTFMTAPDNAEEFGTGDFRMRFVSPGDMAGEWQDCVNYLGTSPLPPAESKVCFLWGSKLYYGQDIDVPAGYTIETETADGLEFTYDSEGGEFITIEGSTDYSSQSFKLRVVDLDGDAGEWTSCLTYTPIALDVDGSGAIEYITGEFTIDVNGDGINETLEQWFAPTEGILIDTRYVIKNGIVSGLHMFGDEGRTFTDGFDKLSRLDVDDDGSVSGSELDGLAVWVDTNSNARMEEDEMKTLESVGILSLSTSHKRFISQAMASDGSAMIMEDKWFVSKDPSPQSNTQ